MSTNSSEQPPKSGGAPQHTTPAETKPIKPAGATPVQPSGKPASGSTSDSGKKRRGKSGAGSTSNTASGKRGAPKQPLTPDQQVASDWRAYRIVICALGIVLSVLGLYELLAGTSSVTGMGDYHNASLENDFRFMAAFVVAAGAGFIAIAIKFGWANLLYLICSAIFLGGLSRVYSWAVSGIPSVWMIILMIIELAVPPVLVVWYLWVRHTEKLRDTYSRQTP